MSKPEIKILKLKSGIDIIGKILQEADNKIEIEDPAMVLHQPDGVHVIPTLFVEKHTSVSLNKEDVLWEYVPFKDLINEYETIINRLFSNIIQPSKEIAKGNSIIQG